MRRLVVWGAGELGGRVAAAWRRTGAPVLATTRTDTRHADLRALGIEAGLGSPLSDLRPTDRLLLSLPGTAAQQAALDALSRALPPHRSVLISSTGFHAGASGHVDETSRVGSGTRPQAIAACERAFLAWAGTGGVVLRCGGLWRLGRGPAEALRRSGRAPSGPPDRSLPLIHYDDAAAAVYAALVHPSPSPIYLCVSAPAPSRREFYEAASQALGLAPPAFEPAVGVAAARFDTARLQRDLLPAVRHPDWRAACTA